VKAEPLAEVEAWPEPYRRLWSERLDRLARHLEAERERAKEGRLRLSADASVFGARDNVGDER
jgi:hypothetical protein